MKNTLASAPGMRGILAAALAAAVVLSMAALSLTGCDILLNKYGDGEAIDGVFTLTEIPSEFDGKYALFYAANVKLVGAESVDGFNVTPARISNGRVSMTMWQMSSGPSYARWNGNDQVSVSHLLVLNKPTYSFSDASQNDAYGVLYFGLLDFKNGGLTKNWIVGHWELY